MKTLWVLPAILMLVVVIPAAAQMMEQGQPMPPQPGPQGAPGPMMPGMGQMGMGSMMCPMCQGRMGGGQGMDMGMMYPMCRGMMLPGHHALMHREALGLSDQQADKIRDIQTEFRKQQIRLGSEVQLAEIDLEQAMKAEKVDMPGVERLVREMNRVQGDLRLAGIRAKVSAQNVLTPDQRKMAESMMMMPGPQPMGMPGPGMMRPGTPQAPAPGPPHHQP
jgi:Spy/CpxP family protein refolding chaperone